MCGWQCVWIATSYPSERSTGIVGEVWRIVAPFRCRWENAWSLRPVRSEGGGEEDALHSLTTVKSLGFIPSLDTKVAPLSVSFLSDPVGDAMNVLDRRCRAFSARIEDC